MVVFIGVIYSVNSQNAYSQPRNYGNYIQPYDFGLLERALQMKQSNYSRNIKIVRNKVNQIDKLLSKLIEIRKRNKKPFSKGQIEYLENYYRNLKKIETWDFSSRTNTQNVLNWLEKIENEFYKWF